MPLPGYDSLCDERQSKIVSKDYGISRKHVAKNQDKCRVSQYRIDGVVIQDTSRCDFLVINEDKRNAYFIELKGSRIEDAVQQLQATANRLKNQLRGYNFKYRIVCSRARTHAINGNKYKKFQKENSKDNGFICKEKMIEEDI